VDQQFQIGQEILNAGFMPILEPEVDIKSVDKSKSEELLKDALLKGLESLGTKKVMFKLSLPTIPGFYAELAEHPNVLRVVALSGGYSRTEANSILEKNPKMIASFSRALAEGLSAQQSDVEFDKALNESIESIYAASVNKLQ
jgi:fructose-bisphosphate aldolase class I